MNQTKVVNKTYKGIKTKFPMKTKILLSLLIFSIFLTQNAFSEDVCRYIPGQTIFRCNDAMPSIVITPGTEQNLTIYCCLTGDAYNTTDNFQVNINIISNESFGKQYMENNTRITETNMVYYNASQWISAYYIPENITGFQTFPLTITYNTPIYSKYFNTAAVIKSRLDVSIYIPGAMIPQLAILPNVMLPADYKPLDYRIYVYLGIAGVASAILLVITFKNNRINQKIKRLLKKLIRKEKHAEHKEHESHQEHKVEKKE